MRVFQFIFIFCLLLLFSNSSYSGQGGSRFSSEAIETPKPPIDDPLNELDDDGNTPLHIAAECGDEEWALFLVNLGANLESVNDEGLTPYQVAVHHRQFSVVQALRKILGIKPLYDLPHPLFKMSPHFNEALVNGHLNGIEKHLFSGQRVNSTNDDGMTPLMITAKYGWTDAILKLLENRANVNLPRASGYNKPLYYAAQFGRTEAVSLLLSNGASVDSINKYNYTPLMGATIYGHLKIVTQFINTGADVNLKDIYGNSPLLLAVQYTASDRVEAVVSILLQAGADLSHKNNEGKDALFFAQRRNLNHAIKLITNKINENAKVTGNFVIPVQPSNSQ